MGTVLLSLLWDTRTVPLYITSVDMGGYGDGSLDPFHGAQEPLPL